MAVIESENRNEKAKSKFRFQKVSGKKGCPKNRAGENEIFFLFLFFIFLRYIEYLIELIGSKIHK